MSVRSRAQSTVVLDWINIRYRTVVLGGILAVLVLGGAAGAWFWWSSRDPQRIEASRAIAAADASVREAAAVESTESYLPPLVDSARSSLARARAAFERSDYTDAQAAAAQARESALAVLQATQAGAGVEEVRFYRLEGDVKVKRSKRFDWESASLDTVLRPGDQVKTSSSGSAQIIYFDGTITTLKPGSLLEIKHLYQNPTTKVQRVAEKLNWGSVSASTQAGGAPGSFHEVSTDNSRSRATAPAEFEVTHNRDSGVSSVGLYSGSLKLATAEGEKGVDVVAGERVELGEQGMVNRSTLLAAPELVSPGDQWTFNHAESSDAVTTLSWEDVPGAHHYHTQISEGSLFSRSVYERADLRSGAVDVEGLDPGAYFWRVAAMTRDGSPGPWSEHRKFRIISKRLGPTNDVTPPALNLDEFLQSGPMIILAGTTEPGAQLWVVSHGTTKRVDVDGSGKFTTVIKLTREGKNRVQIRAQDAAGNESVVTRTATVYSY